MIPSWLTRRAGLTALLALAGVLATTLDLSGRAKIVGVTVVGLIAVISVLQEQRDRHAAAQTEAARARLDVQVTLVPDSIGRSSAPDAFIAAWMESERAACLGSVPSKGAPASRGFRDLDEILDDEAEENGEVKGLTLGEMEHLETRVEVGELLSEEEQARYKDAKNRMRLAGFSAALAASSKIGSFGSALSSPDVRSEGQYRAEVDAYLADGAEMLRAAVRWMEIEAKTARTQVRVHNPTDRNYSAVEVEIYIPGEVTGVDPDEIADLPDPQARPRPFGSRRMHDYGLKLGTLGMPYFPASPHFRHGPSIDNSGSARIRYPAFDLRPRETVLLDPVHLITEVDAGMGLSSTWTATATNADGQAGGNLNVSVRESSLDAEAVLTTWLAGEGDSAGPERPSR